MLEQFTQDDRQQPSEELIEISPATRPDDRQETSPPDYQTIRDSEALRRSADRVLTNVSSSVEPSNFELIWWSKFSLVEVYFSAHPSG
ncbi:hypothetical protein [Nostoc sp.]|uniref:hypothetical protein n=1 Tax=Nostoc sp. TaxID=1180 RepID=UPI002FF903F6